MKSANIYPIPPNKLKKRRYPYYNNDEFLKIRDKLFKPKLKFNDTKEIINILEKININNNNNNSFESLNEKDSNTSISLYSSINIIEDINKTNNEYNLIVEESELISYLRKENKKTFKYNIQKVTKNFNYIDCSDEKVKINKIKKNKTINNNMEIPKNEYSENNINNKNNNINKTNIRKSQKKNKSLEGIEI